MESEEQTDDSDNNGDPTAVTKTWLADGSEENSTTWKQRRRPCLDGSSLPTNYWPIGSESRSWILHQRQQKVVDIHGEKNFWTRNSIRPTKPRRGPLKSNNNNCASTRSWSPPLHVTNPLQITAIDIEITGTLEW